METLGVLDVDGLDVGVQLLLGALLVVTLAGDADAQAEGNTLDAGLPDLLVELGVEADVAGLLLSSELASLIHKMNVRRWLRKRKSAIVLHNHPPPSSPASPPSESKRVKLNVP